MSIREDLVASAAQFLQDPSVAASPVENRIAFLKAKNLTEEEVQAALARAGGEAGPPATYAAPPPPGAVQGQPPAYYGGYPPYGWPQQPPPIPKRDWRDWFIMATVVSGVGYGLYSLGKRYVYPLIVPPTPERLEADKKSIEEQFDKAFALVDQLAKDTEAIKEAEQQRTEKLDSALAELETVVNELKSSNRRREDEAQRIRDDVSNLKGAIPKALDAQKAMAENRLQEVNAELKSLKTILTQRVSSQQQSSSSSHVSRAAPATGSGAAASPSPAPTPSLPGHENGTNGTNGAAAAADGHAAGAVEEAPKPVFDSTSRSPFNSGMSAANVKIPEWQRAMASKKASAAANNNASADAGGSSS